MNKTILAFITTVALLVPSLVFAATPPKAELLGQIKALPKGAILACTSYSYGYGAADNEYTLATGLFNYDKRMYCNINGYVVSLNSKVFLGDSLGKFEVLRTHLHETNLSDMVTLRKMN